MILAVVGGRNFKDREFLEVELNKRLSENDNFFIVSGGAAGADTFAEEWAKKNRIRCVIFKPQYDKYPPKVAPIMRNEQIVKFCTHFLAFHDGKSRGTNNAIEWARKYKRPLEIIYYKPDGQL